MSKKFANKTILGYDDKPIKFQQKKEGSEEITFIDIKVKEAFWLILNNFPLRTMDDSIQGMRLAQSLDKCQDGGVIELEEGVHDWLKKVNEPLLPTVFRVNATIIQELIKEGFIKPVQPREGKEKPSGKAGA